MLHDESLGAVLLQRPLDGERYSTEWTFAHQVRDCPSGEERHGGRRLETWKILTGFSGHVDGGALRMPGNELLAGRIYVLLICSFPLSRLMRNRSPQPLWFQSFVYGAPPVTRIFRRS
jgi:hypothetical protein